MHFEKSQRPQQGPFRESDVSQYAYRLVIKRMRVFWNPEKASLLQINFIWRQKKTKLKKCFTIKEKKTIDRQFNLNHAFNLDYNLSCSEKCVENLKILTAIIKDERNFINNN